MNKMTEEQLLNKDTEEKSIDSYIKKKAIVWFEANNQIHCGRVDDVYLEYRTIWVFNFDTWTHWIVEFDKIVRVGISYYSDNYIKITKL